MCDATGRRKCLRKLQTGQTASMLQRQRVTRECANSANKERGVRREENILPMVWPDHRDKRDGLFNTGQLLYSHPIELQPTMARTRLQQLQRRHFIVRKPQSLLLLLLLFLAAKTTRSSRIEMDFSAAAAAAADIIQSCCRACGMERREEEEEGDAQQPQQQRQPQKRRGDGRHSMCSSSSNEQTQHR